MYSADVEGRLWETFTPVQDGMQQDRQRIRRLGLRIGLSFVSGMALIAAVYGVRNRFNSSRVVLERELDGAQLPDFTAAAIALDSGRREKPWKEATHNEQKKQLGSMAKKAHGDHALGNKALDKIMAAARAAAMKNNDLIREADESLRESQKVQ
jgi:hypothetical protein